MTAQRDLSRRFARYQHLCHAVQQMLKEYRGVRAGVRVGWRNQEPEASVD